MLSVFLALNVVTPAHVREDLVKANPARRHQVSAKVSPDLYTSQLDVRIEM